jgi:4-amino-4-deoxy-L-arabinose transferase-like glycosyltransferase
VHEQGRLRRITAYLVHHSFRPGRWLLSRFSRLDETQRPLLWVIGLFLVQAIPATIVRASNLEEGRIIAIARGAMENGHWLTPYIYGDRFPERPVLLSWISAAFGEVTGGVTLWSLRIPHLAVFLGGAFLIYNLLRSNTSKGAAIFGVLCWLSMPMVAPKFINAEPDIVMSTLLFAAFYVWWQGTISQRITLTRWLGIGLLLGLAGLTKGPQPVAYFTLGVGAYLLLKRQRHQIPAFIAANAVAALVIGGWYVLVHQPNDVDHWMTHSRLLTTTGFFQLVRDHLDFVVSMLAEVLPATILIGPAVIILLRRWKDSEHDLMLAAMLYSLCCTLVLVVWPGGVATRYAMPATLTLAMVCGLMFEHWRQSYTNVIAATLTVAYLITGALLIRSWVVMPFWPHLFQESQTAGKAIAAALQRTPGPLYVLANTTEHNMLVYVRTPIRAVTLGDLAGLKTPALAVLLPAEAAALAQQNPAMRLVDRANVVSQRRSYRIVEIEPSGSR